MAFRSGQLNQRSVRMKEPKRLTAEQLPDIWAINTEYLLKELARIRELALHVPSNTTSAVELHAPINSVIDAVWSLENDLRFCLKLQREMQSSFAKKATTMAAKDKAIDGKVKLRMI